MNTGLLIAKRSGKLKAVLARFLSGRAVHPVGIYDAKTELFHWETARQQHYDQLSLEEQGHLGHHLIAIV